MEVNSVDFRKNIESLGRILRKRKKPLYTDRVVKRRSKNSRRRRITRRHRSLDPPRKEDISTNLEAPRPSTSSGSLESVVYLGHYRKIPPLITLEENYDSDENQAQDQRQNLFAEGQNASFSCYSTRAEVSRERTSNQDPHNSWNETRDTNNLLNLLSEMCVGVTCNRIMTRARTRELKH